MRRSTKKCFVIVSTISCYSLIFAAAANHFILSCFQNNNYFRMRTNIEHFRKNIYVDKFSMKMFEFQIFSKQIRKRRNTEAMKESEEIQKKNAFEPQRHFTSFVTFRYANDEMKKHQNDFASSTSLIVCSSASSFAQFFLEINNFDIWNIETEIEWIRKKFNELNIKRKQKMKTFKTQTLSDAIDRNLIWCYWCQFFVTIDIENLCVNCFHTRCFECKHSDDLKANKYNLTNAEKAKAWK